MDINNVQDFFQNQLPATLNNAYQHTYSMLHLIPQYAYILIIVVLSVLLIRIHRQSRGYREKERQKLIFHEELSASVSLHEAVRIMTAYFKKLEPEIEKLGVYVRENNAYRLIHAQGYGEDTTSEEEASALEQYLERLDGDEIRGRFNIYTIAPGNKQTAVKVVTYNPINIGLIQSELCYLSTLLNNLRSVEETKKELVRTKLLLESKSIFSSTQFDKEEFFLFLGNIILKAFDLDTVKFIFKDREIVLGSRNTGALTGKLLHVRSTDIKVEIFRASGTTKEDIVNTGRMLDMISTIIAMYSSEEHLSNYLYFLETAIGAFENSDTYYRRHSDRVVAVALSLGKTLGFDDKRMKALEYAGKFHDIGMMGDICDITSKGISLSEKEHAKIQYHPIVGQAITAPLDSTYPISNIIMQHHEYLDRTGYPDGIPPEKISMDSRILAFSEVFIGAMSDRPHRKGRSLDEAIREVEAMVPHKIDNDVFQAFMKDRENITAILKTIT